MTVSVHDTDEVAITGWKVGDLIPFPDGTVRKVTEVNKRGRPVEVEYFKNGTKHYTGYGSAEAFRQDILWWSIDG